jgi:hypothetical protein
MAEKEVVETSEAQIAVHWQEENYYHPSMEFIAQANMTDKSIFDRFSLDNFPNCFKEYAAMPRAGNGLSEERSTPVTTASIVTSKNTRIKQPFISSLNPKLKKWSTSPIRSFMSG